MPKRKVRWVGLIFFILLHAIALIGTPLYIYYRGITGPEIALFLGFCAATGLSITIGYHRLFAHSAFKASPVVQFFVLLFGAATFEESALKWASQHRQHHRFTDTEHDPYGVNQGFWHAHIGWIMFWRHRTNYNNVKDLRRSRLVAWQHDHHAWWSVGGGVVLPMLIAWWIGHPLGGLHHGGLPAHHRRPAFVVLHQFVRAHVRHAAVRHSPNSARDNWLCALLTNGEGFHNFHHRFPYGLPQRLPLVSLGPVEVDHLRAVEGGPRLGSSHDFDAENRRSRRALSDRHAAPTQGWRCSGPKNSRIMYSSSAALSAGRADSVHLPASRGATPR